jgi:hypothetical protein
MIVVVPNGCVAIPNYKPGREFVRCNCGSLAKRTRNVNFAVRPVSKISDGEAFEEGICLNYFFSLGSTCCVRGRHNEGGVGILHW